MKTSIASPILVCLTFALLSFPLPADETSPLQQVDGAPDLERVKNGSFAETYVNPDVDFTRYNSLYLGDAVFHYRENTGSGSRLKAGIYSNTRSSRGFAISEKDQAEFQRIVSEAFLEEIVKGERFRVVSNEEADEKTIVMRGLVYDIVSRVPPESAGQVDIYLPTVGEATLILEFLDGKTAEVLARVAERGVIGTSMSTVNLTRKVNRATVIADVKRWARSAARRLRTALDSAIEG